MRAAALILLLLGPAACRRDPPPPPAEPAADASASPPADASGVRILSEGREPRARLSFAFVPGRTEARVLAIDSHMELNDKPRVDEHVEIRFDVRYLSADTVEMTVTHAETTAPDIPRIESTRGAVFRQRFGKDGTTDPPVVTFPPSAQGTAKQYVEGAVKQLGAALLPACPPAPVGEGARWRWGSGEGPVYELLARRGDLVTVQEIIEIHGSRPGDRGKTIEVSEDQSVRVEVPQGGIARHVDSTLVAVRKKGTSLTTHLRFDVQDIP